MHDDDTHTHEGSPEEPRPATDLGSYLASIREDRGMTLRGVEEATEKEVSNAYLSQIEKGRVKKPDPNILHSLSEIYGISYENLMVRAGYIVANASREDSQTHGRVATFAEHALTKDEESELLEYLKFMRKRRKTGGQT
jgi:HTH-type transcriptional regulator, competence development regulator